MSEGGAAGEKLRVFVPSAALLLTDHLPDGEGLIAWDLLSGLARRGHEVVACARSADLLAEPGFSLIETGPSSRWESLESLAYSRRVRRVFERLGGADAFDVCHWIFPQEPVAFTANGRLVVGPMSLRWQLGNGGRPFRPGDAVAALTRPLVGLAHGRSLRGAFRVLASTPAASRMVAAEERAARVEVLPYGIDADRFVPAPLPAEATIVFVGKLEPAKGAGELVEAFAHVAGVVEGSRLLVAGEGTGRASLEARVRELGLSERVSFLGRVSHAAVPELLRRSSLLCLPSHGEPFGMAVLEAMAAGRAVVAVAEGGPAFLVDSARGGRLVPPRDPRALADALITLLSDPAALAAMGAHNRELVEGRFSLERFLDRLEAIYREAAIRA